MAVERSATLESLVDRELSADVGTTGSMRVIFEEIIDLSSGEIVGHEVLTRVDVPERRARVTPEIWYAKARSMGLCASMEARAAELALLGLPLGDGMITVNFSPDCLDTPEVQRALDRLAETGRATVIELSEHHHVGDDLLQHSLSGIRDRGLLIAVDDAGTGESGPDFVREVGPDVIKIDRKHISQVDRHPAQRIFLHAYAQLADAGNALMVTEGVASARVAEALSELGAKWGHSFLGQGYWLSRERQSLQFSEREVSAAPSA
jgi:EAL domain-containing protein (putative c-di-GMP-specific phosphodiesterase class I)